MPGVREVMATNLATQLRDWGWLCALMGQGDNARMLGKAAEAVERAERLAGEVVKLKAEVAREREGFEAARATVVAYGRSRREREEARASSPRQAWVVAGVTGAWGDRAARLLGIYSDIGEAHAFVERGNAWLVEREVFGPAEESTVERYRARKAALAAPPEWDRELRIDTNGAWYMVLGAAPFFAGVDDEPPHGRGVRNGFLPEGGRKERKERLSIPDVLPRFVEYYLRNPVWGSLHLVLSNGNERDKDVEACIEFAREKGDVEGEALGELLLRLSKTQRIRLCRWDREQEVRWGAERAAHRAAVEAKGGV